MADYTDTSETQRRPRSPFDVALQYLGKDEHGDSGVLSSFFQKFAGQSVNPAATPWCRAFVNGVLGQWSGRPGVAGNSLMARDALTLGTPTNTPSQGDLVVLPRGDPRGPYGHVGFYAGPGSRPGTIKVLGGNQGDRVSFSEYPAASVLGYRVPPKWNEVAQSVMTPDKMPGAMGLGMPPADEATTVPGTTMAPPSAPRIPAAAPEPPTYVSENWDTPGPGEAEAAPEGTYRQPAGGPIEVDVTKGVRSPEPLGNEPPRADYNTSAIPAPGPAPGAYRPPTRTSSAIATPPPAQAETWPPANFWEERDRWGAADGGAATEHHKVEKATARYRAEPHGHEQCIDCAMFREPHRCTAVQGLIANFGWCKYWHASGRKDGGAVIGKAIAAAEKQVERNPTEAKKKAGNYAKGHLSFHGLDVAIENAEGSYRHGVDKGGKKWTVKMPAAYGYIKQTEGKDGDHVDVYLGPKHDADKVYVVDQIDADSGKFDEHKCMLFFPSRGAALAAYRRAFSDGRGNERIGSVAAVSMADFKDWLKNGDTTKPLGRKGFADGGKVQNLDALSRGLPEMSPEEIAAARARKEAEIDPAAVQADYEKRKAVARQLGTWPERYIDIDEGRLQNIGRTLRGIDAIGNAIGWRR